MRRRSENEKDTDSRFLLAAMTGWAGSALGAELPPAGVDRFDAIVDMTVKLGPDPTPFRLLLTGPVAVRRGNPQQARGGDHTIATEIVSMDLSGRDQVVGTNLLKVSGIVTDSATNKGLPGYTVFAGPFPPDPNNILSPASKAVTDANGAYSFTVPKDRPDLFS